MEFSGLQQVEALRALGYDHRELARMVADGQLVRVRRGAYARSTPADAPAAHRLLIDATMPRLAPDATLSHASAAVLHELPAWDNDLSRVHVIRPRGNGGRKGTVVHVHAAALEPTDVVALDGRRVTSLARTVADCGRTMEYARAVAVGDAAVQRGLERSELLALLNRPGARYGDPKARRVAGFLRPGAESVGESLSRIVLTRLGVAPTELQFRVTDPVTGELLARTDFAWPEHRTLGEFDGKIKYGRLVPEGTAPGEVVWQEKRREDRLRRLGWEVVRWTWADLHHSQVLLNWIQHAFLLGDARVA